MGWVRDAIESQEGYQHTSCWLRNFVALSAGFGVSGSTNGNHQTLNNTILLHVTLTLVLVLHYGDDKPARVMG